ncbi:MAG: LytTR family transcriptional regulator [Bacteroidales bacterium]|nr:LytTR family transcriptional regulator [Bacteroidales bacterium]
MGGISRRTAFWLVMVFTALHALTCIACRAMGAEDTQALTLLTLAMVFIICNQSGLKIYFTLVALVMINVMAYLIGNALPTMLIPLMGESMWVYAISTSFTTLLLGLILLLMIHLLSRSPLFVNMMKDPQLPEASPKEYRQRWIVRSGDRIVPVSTEQIACFYSKEKCNYLLTGDGERYIVDSTMDDIMKGLDPERFFRINRSCIPALSSIESAVVNSGRYKVEVKPRPDDVSTLVTRSREEEFLRWLEKV